jgi:hypothetical protein
VSGRTEIIENSITLTPPAKQAFRPGKVDTAAIAFGARPKSYRMNCDGSVLISDNTITINRPNATGILVTIYPDDQYEEGTPPGAAREVIVRDNTIDMQSTNNMGSALACLGACSDSHWTDNRVDGSARFGILVAQKEDNTALLVAANAPPPPNNPVDRNDLTGFEASQAQIFIDATAPVVGHHIAVRNNEIGTVSGSNAGATPFQSPCAGIASRGERVELEWNDFGDSGIKGWRLPKEKPVAGTSQVQTGCIYLAKEAKENRVTWWPTDFPPGSAPLPQRQILDLSGLNEIVKAKEAKPVPKLPEKPKIKPPFRIKPAGRLSRARPARKG